MSYITGERGTERAITIRQPATANLFIDSSDGAITASAGKFTIQKPNALQNGFFTRIGATEVVLNYNAPNISTAGNVLNANISAQPIDVNGVGVVTFTIADGAYTVEEAINAWIALVNASSPGGITLSVASAGGQCIITAVGNTFRFPLSTGFLGTVGFAFGGAYATSQSASILTTNTYGVLQNLKYLDFVSPELTYNQDVKDSTSNPQTRDVLCRWYMAFDNDQVAVDGLGFPIYMGYKPFQVRRLYNPPKQIKWEPNMPVGNLSFEVWAYPTTGDAFLFDNNFFSWEMTLQLSEN